MLADESERPLLQPKLGAFLYTDLRPFGGSPEGREHRFLAVQPNRVVAPVPGRDHPAVQVEDALQLAPVERGDWMPVPGRRERRDATQALLAFGAGWRVAFSVAISRRSSAISSSSSVRRTRAGSTSSPHGVP